MPASRLLIPNRGRLWKPSGPLRLDRQHPLAKGLWAVFALNEGAGVAYDLISPRQKVTLVSGVTWKSGVYGPHLSFAGTQTAAATLSTGFTPTGTTWSVDGLFRVPSQPGSTVNYDILVSAAQASGLLYGGSGTGNIGWTIDTNVSSLGYGNQASLNTWVHVAWVYDGTNGIIWQEGVPVSGALANNFTYGWDGIGWDSNGFGTFTGDIALLRIWDGRVLTTAEVQALRKDPFGMLIGQDDRVRSFALGALLAGGTAWNKSLGPDAISELESLTKLVIKPASDALSGTDGTNKLVTKGTFNDQLSGTDTRFTVFGKNLPIDAISSLDSLSKTLSKALGPDFVVEIDANTKLVIKPLGPDALSQTDSLAKTLVRTLLDALSEKDSVTALKVAVVSLSDKFSETDGLTKTVIKQAQDTLSLLDGLTKNSTKPLADALSSLDTLSKTSYKTFLDWVSQLDSVTATKIVGGSNFSRSISDTTSALDALAKQVSKLNSDNFSQIDLFSRVYQAVRTLQDWVVEYESQTRMSIKSVMDGLSQTDRLTVGRGVVLQLLDSVGMLDSVSTLLQHQLGQFALAQIVSLVSAALGMTISLTTSTQLTMTLSLVAAVLSQTVSNF